MTPAFFAAGAALAALAIWRPQSFAVGAILTAPLHVYRRPLPDVMGPLNAPSTNLSLFRLCVIFCGLGVIVHVFREWRNGTFDSQALKSLAPVAAIALLSAAWIGYESWRSLWPLGHTIGSAYVFFFLAVFVIASVLVLRLLRPATALTATAISAVLPLGFALLQIIEPGSGADKYTKPVPLSGLLDAPAGSDQVRAGGLSGGTFRPASFFSDPNFLAVFAAGIVILADPGDWVQGVWQRRSLHLLRIVAACIVMFTTSRTGLIILAAYVCVRYGPAAFSRFRAAGRKVRILVVGLAVAWVALSVSALLVFSAVRGSASTESHVETIRHALDLWWQFPANGAGLGNFGYVFGQAADRSSAQSFPFTILAEQGLIGLALLLALLWGPTIRLAVRLRGLERVPVGVIFLVGVWVYDFPLALDVCAVWLAILVAAWSVDGLRLPPVSRTHLARNKLRHKSSEHGAGRNVTVTEATHIDGAHPEAGQARDI